MSEDYIETTSLTNFALSVPQICKQILEYLDDKSLTNFRILSHFWKNFVDKQRFTWIRIIKEISEYDKCKHLPHRSPKDQRIDYESNYKSGYYKCNSFVHYFEDLGTLNFYGNIEDNCDSEVYAWKTILEKGSLKIVKELGIAIGRLYVLHDDILRSDGTHEKYKDSVFNGIKRHGNKGYHLLIIAAYHGNFELFKEIFELVEDKNPKHNDCPWPSALHTAATFGHFEMCKLILDTLEEKNPRSKTQGSILHIAACYNYQKLFEFVFHQVEEKNPVGGYTSRLGFENGKWAKFGGVAQNSDHWTPLHYSVANGHYEVSKLIVDEIEIKNPKTPSGWTPLHCASKVELCQLILEQVIDRNPETKYGETPLSLAAKSGNVEKFKDSKWIDPTTLCI